MADQLTLDPGPEPLAVALTISTKHEPYVQELFAQEALKGETVERWILRTLITRAIQARSAKIRKGLLDEYQEHCAEKAAALGVEADLILEDLL